MPLFQCTKCRCIENTAVCGYNWLMDKSKALCSECDPEFGKWHGIFEKKSAIGLYLGNDGFLYHEDTVNSDQLDWRIKHQGFMILKKITE